MQPLAAPADVAGSLGLTEDQLSAAQRLRVPLITARLSGLFRRESGCVFTPGTTTVRLISVAGRITLPDILNETDEETGEIAAPGTVYSVQRYHDGKACEFTLVGQDVLPTQETILGSERPGTGDLYVVTYTHRGQVPDEVKSCVAGSAARYLTVDPKSAVAQSTFLSSEGYHQRMAQWVADSVKLSESDIQTARAYRSTPAMPIVHKGGHTPKSVAYSSWGIGEGVL